MVGKYLVAQMYLLCSQKGKTTLFLITIHLSSHGLFNRNSYVPNKNISCYIVNDISIWSFFIKKYNDFEYDYTVCGIL